MSGGLLESGELGLLPDFIPAGRLGQFPGDLRRPGQSGAGVEEKQAGAAGQDNFRGVRHLMSRKPPGVIRASPGNMNAQIARFGDVLEGRLAIEQRGGVHGVSGRGCGRYLISSHSRARRNASFQRTRRCAASSALICGSNVRSACQARATSDRSFQKPTARPAR